MRYLVLGGSGLLGHRLVSSLSGNGTVSFTYLNNPLKVAGAQGLRLDLAEPEAVAKTLQGASPDAIIHAIAPPSVDWHERERAAAYKVNVEATRQIAEYAKSSGAKLAYVSSSFVFPDTGKTFSEGDIPAPINFYGAVKHGAEIAAALAPAHVIVRTDQIYGWALPGQKKSFVAGTLEKLGRKEKVEVCRDWLNAPTYVGDLADVILRLLEKGLPGAYHVTGSSFLNRHEWGMKIARAFGMDPSLVTPIDSATLNLPARRPNVRLSTERVQQVLGMRLKSVDEGLEAMKAEAG